MSGQATLFHSELKTSSAPNHSVCFMFYDETDEVRLFAYRYDGKGDLRGNGRLFENLDLARKFAYECGYIMKDDDRASLS